MGLIHCPDCHGAVSEYAETCIHCGAPLKRRVTKQYIESLKEERKELTQKRDVEHKKYLEKVQEINTSYSNKVAALQEQENADKKAGKIVIIIAVVILVIHLFNPNWWLLLTVPLCLGTAFGVYAAIDGVAYGPYSDNPSSLVEENIRLKKEKEDKLREAQKEFGDATRKMDLRIKSIDIELIKNPNV